jgi:CRISPR-associated exonuclease Cas4
MVLRGRDVRSRRGLSQGRTLDLDGRNLYSARYGLAGRPDRVFDDGGMPVPEEWKSARRVYDSHVVQLGTYFVLIEEETGVRPPHGFIALGDDQRVRIENKPELRARVLGIADQIRAMRREIEQPIPVSQPAVKCRECRMREACWQRKG